MLLRKCKMECKMEYQIKPKSIKYKILFYVFNDLFKKTKCAQNL